MGAELNAGASASAACRATLFARPEFADFARRTPLRTDEPGPGHLTASGRIQPHQRDAYAAFAAEIVQCREMAASAFGRTMPALLPAQMQANIENDRNRARLMAGEITWGEANAYAYRVALDFKLQSVQVAQGVAQEIEMEHAREMSNRAMVAGVLGAAVGAAVTAPLAPRPRYVYAPTYVFRRR